MVKAIVAIVSIYLLTSFLYSFTILALFERIVASLTIVR